MMVVTWILLAVLLLGLTLLVLPVRFQGQVRLANQLTGHGEIAVLANLIALQLVREDQGPVASKLRLGWWSRTIPAGTKKPARPKRKKSQGWRSTQIGSFLSRRLWTEFFHYLSRMVAALHLEARLEGEYGTGDPALTGFLTGLISMLAAAGYGLRLQPNYLEAMIDIEGELRGRVIPAVALWHTGVLLLKPVVRPLWWPKGRMNRNRKQEVFSHA